MDLYFRWEVRVDEAGRGAMLAIAFDEIKDNTYRLTWVQREKIRRFEEVDGWRLHRVDATPAMMWRNGAAGERVWEEIVVVPCIETTRRFIEGSGGTRILKSHGHNLSTVNLGGSGGSAP
ncbi:hypothetical protein KSP40_PGU014541 [Platanthera guangdongensis]|uniref:Uncharacterized protein n=1 Tax=Platanthera guangdongensis TaxID=2320717 RepID=A0ABR2M972_9ASPA